ncbi:hypothetical protein GOBAR_AA32545 [Gossypium barbadense]|uniref:DUF4283 domain-containing protein n=1 Tax=Gossypium barbadense TaxID=3634 RepID=A0A2P5WAN0_GOSBA|nr:hypothetical protein GOBAR_AA32545 [Gossypium barbadense]
MVTDDVGGAPSNGDHTTKKAKVKRIDVDMNSDVIIYSNGKMSIDPPPTLVVSWKGKVVGNGSSGLIYKQKILEEIDRLIFKVVKLDFQTDSGVKGKFARLVVFLDMGKPLISKIFVDEQGKKRELGPVNSAGNKVDRGSILVDNTRASLGELSQPNLKGNGEPILKEAMGYTQLNKVGFGSLQTGSIRLNTQAAWVEENMIGSPLNVETNSGMKLISTRQQEVPPT